MKDSSFADNMKMETELSIKGYTKVACVDECGRGCFAGPVVAAAVIMKPGVRIPFLTDSKKLPKKYHEDFVKLVKQNSFSWNISVVESKVIDEINILQASLLAMKNAIEGLPLSPDYCLIDGNQEVDLYIPQQSIVKGDYFSHGISAASLLAKHYRDNLMAELDEKYNFAYDWSNNAGYPTKKHIELTKKNGVTPFHRVTWKTMNKI